MYVINVRTHKMQIQNVCIAKYNANCTLHTFTQFRSKLICSNIDGHKIERNIFECECVNGLSEPCWALSKQHTHAFLRSLHHLKCRCVEVSERKFAISMCALNMYWYANNSCNQVNRECHNSREFFELEFCELSKVWFARKQATISIQFGLISFDWCSQR